MSETTEVVEKTQKSQGKKTVAMQTLGCRSNQYDSSAIDESLTEAGLSSVPFTEKADGYVINTCTVTGKTDSQSRQLIRKARRKNKDAVIIVTGCYAQVSSAEISEMGEVDYVLGNSHKNKVAECIIKGRPREGVKVMVEVEPSSPLMLRRKGKLKEETNKRTRINLKVQDGCERHCSYCIIPRARGRSRSVSISEAVKEARSFVDEGTREMIFTGIHLGGFGLDHDPPNTILDLLKAFEKENFPTRFRISSIDPDEVTTELIEVLKNARTICNHLHLPLQSGDDKILGLMNRLYTADEFRAIVTNAVNGVKDIAVGIDVMAGFPGEGEAEFENTYNLIAALPLAYLHVFPFSKRAETPAAVMSEQVREPVIKARALRLRELDAYKREAFYEQALGSEKRVLIEGARDKKTGFLKGRTRNYIPVFVDGSDNLIGEEVIAELFELRTYGMIGRVD